jgi:hypothetical protein
MHVPSTEKACRHSSIDEILSVSTCETKRANLGKTSDKAEQGRFGLELP